MLPKLQSPFGGEEPVWIALSPINYLALSPIADTSFPIWQECWTLKHPHCSRGGNWGREGKWLTWVTGSPRIRTQYVIAFIALLPAGLRQRRPIKCRPFYVVRSNPCPADLAACSRVRVEGEERCLAQGQSKWWQSKGGNQLSLLSAACPSFQNEVLCAVPPCPDLHSTAPSSKLIHLWKGSVDSLKIPEHQPHLECLMKTPENINLF